MATTAFTDFQSEVARFNHEVSDLEGTMDELVKVLQRAVRRLRNELLNDEISAVKSRNQTLTAEFGKRLKEVTLALSAATTCQNALRKTAKERAAQMTPEQRREALHRMVLDLPYGERRHFIASLAAAHTTKRQEALAAGVETKASNNEAGGPLQGGPSTLFVELA